MEALLIEMRFEQDVQLKKITALENRLDSLTDHVSGNGARRRRISASRKQR